jgi:hypothetical protein
MAHQSAINEALRAVRDLRAEVAAARGAIVMLLGDHRQFQAVA